MAAVLSLQSAMGALAIGGFSSSSLMGVGAPQPHSLSLGVPLRRPSVITMEIKRWERKEVKPNSLPVLKKLHVKVGDTVKIIAGAEKGKIGEISRVFRHNSKVIVKDVNLKTKHVKPKAEGETGQIVQVEAPVHSSNVMLYSKTAKVASRVGHKLLDNGKRVRYLLKTGEVIDSPEEWKRVHKAQKKK